MQVLRQLISLEKGAIEKATCKTWWTASSLSYNMEKGWQLELYGYYNGPVWLYRPADTFTINLTHHTPSFLPVKSMGVMIGNSYYTFLWVSTVGKESVCSTSFSIRSTKQSTETCREKHTVLTVEMSGCNTKECVIADESASIPTIVINTDKCRCRAKMNSLSVLKCPHRKINMSELPKTMTEWTMSP